MLQHRFNTLGPVFTINNSAINPEQRSVCVTRAFISDVYGGSPQGMLPPISEKYVRKHKMNDFMFPDLVHNPYLPIQPGHPGMMFRLPDELDKDRGWEDTTEGKERRTDVQRVFVKLAQNEWVYVGQYAMSRMQNLGIAEWRAQGPKVCFLSFFQHF